MELLEFGGVSYWTERQKTESAVSPESLWLWDGLSSGNQERECLSFRLRTPIPED
jgi:hypothetical protein